jgi:hypothetical protein
MTAQTIRIKPEADGSISIEIPQPRKATEAPLTISEFLGSKGMPVLLVRKSATEFGKAMKAYWKRHYGQEPPTVDRWIGGAIRTVAHYTETDRAIFEAVYRERAWVR